MYPLDASGNLEKIGTRIPELITDTAIAARLPGRTDGEGFPIDAAWEAAPPLWFCVDWQGKNEDRRRETHVRLLWTPEFLFVRFDAQYRDITVFPDADSNGRRDCLWDRDVCEAFLQTDSSDARRYKEIEVAPNGFWIDLEIVGGEKRDLKSNLRRRVSIDPQIKQWRAILAVPMKRLTDRFDPNEIWRANFFRVEGASEPRFYSAWRPTLTPQPNFHVPQAFGALVFTEPASKIRR